MDYLITVLLQFQTLIQFHWILRCYSTYNATKIDGKLLTFAEDTKNKTHFSNRKIKLWNKRRKENYRLREGGMIVMTLRMETQKLCTMCIIQQILDLIPRLHRGTNCND